VVLLSDGLDQRELVSERYQEVLDAIAEDRKSGTSIRPVQRERSNHDCTYRGEGTAKRLEVPAPVS
jgi:hypothetical protein